MNRVLVTGANGQIGTELVPILQERHGRDNVIASDLRPSARNGAGVRFETLDVRDDAALRSIVERHEVDTVYHLASLLSATGESRPALAWDVNIDGLRHVLELSKSRGMRIFWPSSIAVFGPSTPRRGTPQQTVLEPTTIYGITKMSGELLCRYYHDRFGVDVRSLRYPGIISHRTPPGGGTTDFAVDVFYAAVEGRTYSCFVLPDTRLPMMYMDDAIRATLELMDADADRLTVWTSYNLAATSFSAGELMSEIRRQAPGLEVAYDPDHRQTIAESWPEEVDDSVARRDWDWRHRFELPDIVENMLHHLRLRAERAAEQQANRT